jgi:hypothetical protein
LENYLRKSFFELKGPTHSVLSRICMLACLISLRLGFRRNFCLYVHPNLVSSPIMGILEIFNLTPGSFRWIFCHGRIVSDQVQVIFHI